MDWLKMPVKEDATTSAATSIASSKLMTFLTLQAGIMLLPFTLYLVKALQ